MEKEREEGILIRKREKRTENNMEKAANRLELKKEKMSEKREHFKDEINFSRVRGSTMS